MDLELLSYINLDMKWTVMRKGRTGMTRRPRKLGADTLELFKNKSGIDVVDAPSKKRRLLHPLASPTPQTPSIHREDPGQRCRSNSPSQKQKTKSKTRLKNSKILKATNKKVLGRDDFSGIELLADVACSTFINDKADRVEDSVLKEHTTLPGVDTSTVDIKDAEANVKEVEEKNVALSKELRLHWDLNTVMDEWEEPCNDLLVEPLLPVKHEAPITLVEILEEKKIDIKALNGGNSASKSELVDSLTNPVKCEDVSNSTTSVLVEQTVVKFESVSKSEQQPVSEECCGSNVTQEEQGHMAEGDSEDKIQAGYDSPFEDGELRELIEKPVKETVCKSEKVYEDDLGTIENPLSKKVDHGQTTGGQTSLLVKEAVPNDEIKQRGQVERPRFDESRKDLCERKDGHHDVSTSFDFCRNGEYIQRNRSSASGDFSMKVWDLKSHRSLDSNYSRNYNPRGGSYRTHDRRLSPSERNNGYGGNRGPPPARSHSRDRYRFHSQEYHDPKPCYFERKPRFSPNLNRHGTRPRSRSRSRSGSPIAWHFQKRKNLDSSNSGEIETVTRGGHMSPERSSRCFDDRRFRDGQFKDNRQSSAKQRFDPIGYPERLKSDEYFRFSQRPARFSQMAGYKYKDKQ